MSARILRLLAAFSAVALFAAAPSAAKDRTLCHEAWGVRAAVVHKHGQRAPGRNVCRFGVKTQAGARPATTHEKARYVRALRRLNSPPPAYLAKHAAPPGTPPAGTLSVSYTPTGTAACIVQRESGGNPQASNGTHFGIAQWSYSTWRAHGGPRMTGASDPRQASYNDQLRVLSHALATVGSGDWTPYDGC
jgi:hypothetical protein